MNVCSTQAGCSQPRRPTGKLPSRSPQIFTAVVQAFFKTWDEQIRKQLEWTDTEYKAFTDHGHNKDYRGRTFNTVLMRGRPAHPQMERFTADGAENPEFVRHWMDMYKYEFPWLVEFEDFKKALKFEFAVSESQEAAKREGGSMFMRSADLKQKFNFGHNTHVY